MHEPVARCDVCGRTILRGRAPERLPARRPAARGLRAVHAARGARGLDPRGRATPRPAASPRLARRGSGRSLIERLRARRPGEAELLVPRRPRGCSRRMRSPSPSVRARAGAAGRAAALGRRLRRRRAADVPRGPRHVHAVPTNADLKVARAIELFNASEHRRTIAGRGAHARRAARDRAPVGDRGQRRHDRGGLGAVLVPLRGRPRRRGRRRPRDAGRATELERARRRPSDADGRTRSPTSTARCTCGSAPCSTVVPPSRAGPSR